MTESPMKRLPSTLLSALLLAACGQTGPLYLPDQAPPKHGLSLRPDTHAPSEEKSKSPAPSKSPSPAAVVPTTPAATPPPPPSASSIAPPSASSVSNPPAPVNP
jgi:predicted small lipoprotein YifL